MLLGPDANGNYLSTVIKSMQRKRFAESTAFLIDNNIDSVLGPKSRVLRQVNVSRWRLSGFVEHRCGKEWCS